MKHWYFEVVTKNSMYEGEEFLVEAKDKRQAQHLAEYYFPNEKIRCYGTVSEIEAERMGLDEY